MASVLALRDRFLVSIHPVDRFFRFTGLELLGTDDPSEEKSKKRKWNTFWIVFWLLFNTESGIYIFFKRATLHIFNLLFAFEELRKHGKLTEDINAALMRLAAFVFETSTHFVLVLTIRPTLKRLIDTLEPVDRHLGRPDLSAINRCSKASVVLSLWTVKYFLKLCIIHSNLITHFNS